ALINVFLFKGNYGDISNALIFENQEVLKTGAKYSLFNLSALVIGGSILTALLHSRLSKFALTLSAILFISFLAETGLFTFSIQKEYITLQNRTDLNVNTDDKAYRVSRTGKNIFIFMLDRAMNYFIDPIFENSEKVRKAYTGFTLYENTVCLALRTNISTPTIFGGYEYTPENINKRPNELLVDKHNEAFSVLPRLFSEHDWNVSFTDPSWLNYSWRPDLTPFKKYNMIAQNTEYKYDRELVDTDRASSTPRGGGGGGITGLRRNILYFSFFKILPAPVRRIFYIGGRGLYAGNVVMHDAGQTFTRAYHALGKLSDEVNFVNSENCLNLIVNNTTHEPIITEDVISIHKEFLIPMAENYCLNSYTKEHFYVNYLTHEKLAEFFDFLKENNCYDNSRIIIVSDHAWWGIETTNMPFTDQFKDAGFDVRWAVPLMLVKDFNSNGALKKDKTFMTLADTPILATEGLAPELQINPFSEKAFKESQDKKIAKIMFSAAWDASKQKNLTQYVQTQDLWAYVHDNAYDPACWSWTRTKKE
ncbi:MAG: hypothetical protein ACTTKL_04400, partial [Treponema sp.]